MDELHSLLKRQLKRHFGASFSVPPQWQDFIRAVNDAYIEFDSDRGMLERSLEISSQELIQANAETRSIIQLFPDAFLWLDQDGTVLNYRSSGQNGLDWLQGILNGASIHDMQPDDVREVLHRGIRRSIETGSVSSVNFSVAAEGQTKYYEARVIPPFSDRILVVIRDVSEQRMAEERVRESERRFHELADLLPVIVIEADLEGNISFINRLAYDIYGYTREEFSKGNIFDFIPVENRQQSVVNFHRVIAGEDLGNLEYDLMNRDGSRDSFIIRLSPIKNSRGVSTGIRGVLVNISDRKRIEKELQESEEKYRGLVENIKLGIFRTVPGNSGKLIEFNQAMEEITGYSRDELLNLEVVNLYTAPEEREKFIHQLNLTPNKASLTTHLVRKDGTHIDVSMIAQAVKDETGKLIFIDGTIEDITERKKLEDRIIDLYEEEKRHREALQEEAKARGMFIDVLAHELRTPLTPILVSISMLKDMAETQPDSVQKKLSRNIYSSAHTLASRLEELLDIARYSRGTFKLNLQTCDIVKYLKEAVNRFRPTLDKTRLNLVMDIPETLPEVVMDCSRLEQVLINLLSNAVKFSPEGGEIVLTVRVMDNQLLLEVKDTGIGITLEEQNRLFQPYHRVEQDRQKFPGIGLGLSVCKQIVEAHHGEIWVTSQPGKGSTFGFSIPLELS